MKFPKGGIPAIENIDNRSKTPKSGEVFIIPEMSEKVFIC